MNKGVIVGTVFLSLLTCLAFAGSDSVTITNGTEETIAIWDSYERFIGTLPPQGSKDFYIADINLQTRTLTAATVRGSNMRHKVLGVRTFPAKGGSVYKPGVVYGDWTVR
jgi:hypothetical protein